MSKRQQWLKFHTAVDAEDLSTQNLVITDGSIVDSQVFPALLKQINQEQKIETVYGDGAMIPKAVIRLSKKSLVEAKMRCKKN